jgi:hypothetical protein
MRRAGHVAYIGNMTNSKKNFIKKPEGKRLHGKPKRRWGDNMKLDIKEVGCDYVDWIHLAQDRTQR